MVLGQYMHVLCKSCNHVSQKQTTNCMKSQNKGQKKKQNLGQCSFSKFKAMSKIN